MRAFSKCALSIALAAATALSASALHAKGLDATRISLPKGPGSVEGLGKSFSPSLASGTASYGVDIAVPPAAAGHAPKLSLDYDSGGGISDLGIGWQLGGVAEIRRRTENGLPKFDESDAFEIVGFGPPSDLLEIAARTYRPQYESGSFVRVQRSADGKTWEARDKSGTTYRFGGEGFVEEEGGRVATWLLREQLDVYGHSIKYTWKTDGAHGRLERVVYNDFSSEARNEVVFKYEARPDAHVRFNSGIKEEFRDRVTAIEVRHGGSRVRRYDLAYSAGPHSQLASVTMLGTDGATKLPTLSLGYTEPKLAADAGGLVTMKAPPGRSPSDANVDLADLDGDGLPDLLVTKAGAYRTYINHDGLSWKAPIDWSSSASPSLELSQIGVQLADLDGDGALDLVAKSGVSYFRYFPGKDASSFAPAVSIATVPNFTFEDADVRVADMDGDRRADVVVTTTAGLAIGFNKNGADWTEPKTIGIVDDKQPLRFSDGRTQLCDINGDRVQDLCYLHSGALVYWLGRGRGKFEPARSATGIPEFDSTAPYQLVDLDGDGWLDLLRVGVSNVEFALASGEGAFGAVRVISGTPTRGSTTAVKLADMNGSGTADIVWIDASGSSDTAWRYLELFPEGRGGLLRSIDNGLGKRVMITYAPAAREAAAARDAGTPWATRMNVGMSVVKSIAIDSGLGDPVIRTECFYRDGTFSPVERTFAGFGGGVEKAVGDEYAATLLTDSTYDVGLSDRTLRGVLLAGETRDEKGYVFKRTKSTWLTRKLDAALDGRFVTYSFLRAEDVQHVEGTDASKAKTTLTEWEQDNYGNVTAEKKWGQVSGGDKLAGNDEAITIRTFANNTSDWILGRVATEELQDGKGARVRMRRMYYDGAAFVGLPLGQLARGNLSREEAWVGPALEVFQLVNSTRYDSDGNPVETKDPREGGRLFEWDTRSHAFVVTEGIKTGSRVLYQRAAYDTAFGNIVAFTGFSRAASTFGYDPLGRPIAIVKPGDSAERPTLRYAYELASPLSRVTTYARRFSGHDEVDEVIALHDGLGRKRATFAEDGPGRWAVSGLALFDARGNERRSIIPFFANTTAVDAAFLRPDAPGHDSFRDAIGRTIRTRSQLGLESRSAFEPLLSKGWDANQANAKSPYEHTPDVTEFDGLGRVVRSTRFLAGKPIIAAYAYSAASDLLSRVDPENNTSRYAYDGRGRRLLVDDPDAGKHRFVFDAVGNVVEHHAPDGKIVRYAYDLANRPIAEDWNGDGTAEVVRTYDEGGETLLGQLSSVTDPSGSASYAYDARGRLLETVLSVQGSTYKTGSEFDALDRKYLHKYPDDSSIRIEYGARGLVTGYGKGAVSLAYDADGRETQRSFNTGVTSLNGYDADRRHVAQRVSAPNGAIIQHLEWRLDGVGNILELLDKRPAVDPAKDRSEVYTHDNLYRLTGAKGRWGETKWSFSSSGRILSRTSTDATQDAGALAYGARAHAPVGIKGRTIEYDARGRMLGDGDRAYTWDDDDHLIAVRSKTGASEDNVFDADGLRRIRLERDGNGAHTTIFIDDWSEVRDGKVVRFIVHGGQRIVRVADGNGAPSTSTASSKLAEGDDEPPPAPKSARAHAPVAASSLFLTVALLAAITARYRRSLFRVLPMMAPIAILWALGASSVGCKGPNEDEPPQPQEGTVLVLGEADELLFSDSIGSLTETTSGSGAAKASSASFPFGATRYDSSGETRKFANTPRDGVGLDQMGVRSYAPELGVFTSVDPVLVHDPVRLVDAHPSAGHYSYADNSPLAKTDRSGQFADGVKVVVDAAAKNPVLVVGGAAAATQAVPLIVRAAPYIAGAVVVGAVLWVGYQDAKIAYAYATAPPPSGKKAPGSAAGGLAAAPASGTTLAPAPGPPPPLPAAAAGGAGKTGDGGTKDPCYAVKETYEKLRKEFDTDTFRMKLWKKEMEINGSKYTPEQKKDVEAGRPPKGSDGFTMEIHHKVPLANCGTNDFSNMQFMTRTDHRLGPNYKKNHPNVKKPK